MITKFKLYESINLEITRENQPEVGDYVICRTAYRNYINQEELDYFLENNIGKIKDIERSWAGKGSWNYVIKFDIVPEKLIRANLFTRGKQRAFVYETNTRNKEIVAWSKNEKELETYIEANKYNL